MDDATLGLIGGIAGCVIGVGGGLFGTYCAVKNAKTPAARRVTIRFSIAIWALVSTLLLLLYLLPFPYRGLVFLPYGIALGLLVRRGNREEALARAADETPVLEDSAETK